MFVLAGAHELQSLPPIVGLLAERFSGPHGIVPVRRLLDKLLRGNGHAAYNEPGIRVAHGVVK